MASFFLVLGILIVATVIHFNWAAFKDMFALEDVNILVTTILLTIGLIIIICSIIAMVETPEVIK